VISSMTAFAVEKGEFDWGTLTWELRTVNQRFLDQHYRLPEVCRVFEPQYRQLVQAQLKRGKLDASLKLQFNETATTLNLDKNLLTQLQAAAQQVQDHFPAAQANLNDLLRWPGVLQKNEIDTALLQQASSDVLAAALVQLGENRQREGAQLQQVMLNSLAQIEQLRQQIVIRMPVVAQAAKDNIIARFTELQLDLEADRLDKEVVFLLHKMDVAEEMQRLAVHIEEARASLEVGGVVGRRLDFLMQEFNRETNTTGSKSVDADVTKAVIEIKVLIEQIREQVQNIE
jgi:uncharacterized protein (TIGR00255 family)